MILDYMTKQELIRQTCSIVQSSIIWSSHAPVHVSVPLVCVATQMILFKVTLFEVTWSEKKSLVCMKM